MAGSPSSFPPAEPSTPPTILQDQPASAASPPSFLEVLGETLFPGPHLLPATTLAQIADTYDYTLRARGPTAKSVLWRGRWPQWWRFRMLLAILTAEERKAPGLTINDFGCGYGALYRMLRRKPYMRRGAYYGYDVCPAMVRAARLTAPVHRGEQPEPIFIDSDHVTQMADFTLCSGTFGLRLDTPPDQWRLYVQETLRQLAAKSRRGLAFNLLDVRQDGQKKTLYYADRDDYLDFCRRELSPHTRLVEGAFSKVDFTLHVRL